MDNIIKPCPFCGGMAILDSNYNYSKHLYYVSVKCDTCGAQGKAYKQIETPKTGLGPEAFRLAINAWNTRTETQTA